MSFDFQINLTGNFQAQIGAVNAGLAGTDKEIKKTADGLRLFEVEAGKATAQVGALTINMAALKGGGSLFTFDLAQGAQIAYQAIGRLADKVFDLGKSLVRLMADTQDLNLALELNLGKEGAEGIDQLAESFGNTRFDDDAIKSAILPLTEQGIKDQELLGTLTTAAIDIATRRKQGIEGVQSSLEAFGKIALKGEIDGKALRQLAIGEADFYKNLAQDFGGNVDAAKKAVAAGRVNKEGLLAVVLDEIQKREGGALGNAALRGGGNLGGTLQRLEDLPGNLFKRLADSPGAEQLQKNLDNLITRLSTGGADSIVNGVGKALVWLTSDETIQAVEDIASAVGSAIKGVAYVFDTLGEAIGFVAFKLYSFVQGAMEFGESIGDWLGRVVVELAGWWGTLTGWFEALPQRVYQFGVDIVRGLADGITSAVQFAKDAITGLADSTVGWFKETLGIASPSRVFRELGANTGEGFALGLEDAEDKVADARLRITGGGEAVAAAGAGAAGASGGSLTLNMPVNVNVTGATDPRETGLQVAQATRLEVVNILREVGFRLGAPVPA